MVSICWEKSSLESKMIPRSVIVFEIEYMSLLIQKQGRNKNGREPKIGKVELIGDDSKKQLNWPLAIIMDVLPCRDGKVRTVKVEPQSGVSSRPVQLIFPLELRSNEIDSLTQHEMVNIVKESVCSDTSSGAIGCKLKRCIRDTDKLNLS
ncbi:hypothetical protein AVEN_36700-1 [Araneus ventricosus]|uniref:DUF5641 domain-containing protein n=1 Tax=Araneus ventricosus TaxID=182803 RepID=A0A4Y2PC86_ARAVE|nr:hypothetical protein AVEN_36700-1 [Araneus ventricosus]